MHLRLRAVLVAVGAGLLAALLLPQGAAAQEAPSISVTPSTGLADGEMVTVTGGPFLPLVTAGVFQCAEPVNLTDVLSVISHCTGLSDASFDAQGNLVPTSVTVHEVFTSAGGVVPPGAITYDCTVMNNCSVAVVGFLASDRTLVGATAPISFGPGVPTTRASCLSGGWRDLANDQGQNFRNQGQCVSYVVAHRP
jgi:hypothetical protein